MQLTLPFVSRFVYKLLRTERRKKSSRGKPVTLSRQRIFILPTRYGVIFAVLLFVMLVGSTNYSNSLGYAFTFLLTAISMVSILHTYRNLARLTFRASRSTPVFCGDMANFNITIDNQSKTERFVLSLGFDQHPDAIKTNVPAKEHIQIQLPLPTIERGWLEMPVVTVSTQYPLSLFRAWSHMRLNTACLVYPKPLAMDFPTYQGTNREGSDNTSLASGTDDFSGFRNYYLTDSPRHVNWKAVARGQAWMTKQFSSSKTEELWFDWESVNQFDVETRLSILCHWVIDAERCDLQYGLKLPNKTMKPGTGEFHKHQCLETLALFDHE
ncbi:MAG: DUF58 domain-containing protein [Gammaproteobacteria bacterium]